MSPPASRLEPGVRLARYVLLGEGTVASLVTRLVVLVAGVGAVVLSAMDLSVALRPDPLPMSCADWLEAPQETRWVSLSGCHLDLRLAGSRRWKGWWLGDSPDAGRKGRMLELFIPLSPTDERDWPVRGVVATSDPRLLGLLDELAGLEVAQVGAFLDSHTAELEALLTPAQLRGYVEPLPSVATRVALSNIEAEGAVVLKQDLEPPRANAVFTLLVGVALVAGVLVPMVARWRRGGPVEQ